MVLTKLRQRLNLIIFLFQEPKPLAETKCSLVTSLTELKQMCDTLKIKEEIAIDLEVRNIYVTGRNSYRFRGELLIILKTARNKFSATGTNSFLVEKEKSYFLCRYFRDNLMLKIFKTSSVA